MTGGILKKFSTKTYWFWEITQGTPPPYLKTLLLKLNDQFNIIFHCFCIGGTVLSSDSLSLSFWIGGVTLSQNILFLLVKGFQTFFEDNKTKVTLLSKMKRFELNHWIQLILILKHFNDYVTHSCSKSKLR